MADRDYTIVGPGGRELTITGPEGATADQLRAAAEKAFGAAPEQSMGKRALQQVGNLAAGAVRGAGSIGATILAPIDIASDALAGKGLTLESNRQRRADMDAALSSMGADTNSLAYGGGKLAGEIAGTAGAGGVIANTLGRAGFAAPNALQAIRTAGMNAGSATGKTALALRTGGGAATGAASAGLVNPEDAGTGSLIGGALPGAVKAAGIAGQKIGGVIRGPAQAPDMTAAVQAARSSGYVIPPTQANPTLSNRLLEGFSGKITTAQNASAKNQAVTSGLVAKELGLSADTKITPDVLTGIRKQAGQAYDAIGTTGVVTPPASYGAALDSIAAPFVKSAQAFPNAKPSPVLELVESLRSPSFDAGAAVEKIKQLRTAADDAFRSGNTDIARASKSAAGALEDALDGHLQALGQPQMLQAFRDSRQLIAKTYTVEKALNPASGAVDARKLAAQLAKNKPLSGGIKDAAEFAARFPKAAQTVEGMGSLPQTSPLDWIGAGTLSGVSGNPLVMLGALARPAARAAALSPMVQNNLAQTTASPNAIRRLLSNQELAQFGYRAAPVLGSGR
jgi:hypothetical protein